MLLPRVAATLLCFVLLVGLVAKVGSSAPTSAVGSWVADGGPVEDLRAGASSDGPSWPAQDSSQYSPWLIELGGRLVMYYCKNIQMNQSGTMINRDRVHRVERASNGSSWGASTVAVEGTNKTAPDDLSCSPGVATVDAPGCRDNEHHMYYVGAARAKGMTLFLLHAVSNDAGGENWTRCGLVDGSWPQPFPGYFETPTPIFDQAKNRMALYFPANLKSSDEEVSGLFVSYSATSTLHQFSAPMHVPSTPQGSQAGRLILPQPACMASAAAADATAMFIYSTSIKGAPPTTVSIASGPRVDTLGHGVEIFRASRRNNAWDGDRVWSPTALWVHQPSGGCELVVYYAGNVGNYRWWGANTSIGH
eukprot:COSAG05_NODE_4041_length_1704_cov_1.421184_1_plen_362_part_10